MNNFAFFESQYQSLKSRQSYTGKKYYSRITRDQNLLLTDSQRLTWFLIKKLTNFTSQTFSIKNQFKYIRGAQSLRTFQYNVLKLQKLGLVARIGAGVYSVKRNRRGRPIRQEMLSWIKNKEDSFFVSFLIFLAFYRYDYSTLHINSIQQALGCRRQTACILMQWIKSKDFGRLKREIRETVFFCDKPAYWHFKKQSRQKPDISYQEKGRFPFCVLQLSPIVESLSNQYWECPSNAETHSQRKTRTLEKVATAVLNHLHESERNYSLEPLRLVLDVSKQSAASSGSGRKFGIDGVYNKNQDRHRKRKRTAIRIENLNKKFYDSLNPKVQAFIISTRKFSFSIFIFPFIMGAFSQLND